MVEALFPERCVGCGAAAAPLCPACLRALRPLHGPGCARCGAPTAWPVARCRECAGRRLAFATARAAVAHAGPARALVAAWKERGRRPLVHLAATFVEAHVERPAADVITYIPPDDGRLLRRGHHPAAALAAELASRWQLEHACLLARTRPVRPQRGLGLAERRLNVRGAFAAAAPVPPGVVVLVDDVYTTGSTVSEAAGALRAGGARTVHVVTFSRAVR